MIALSCAIMLAASIMAVAVAASSPPASFAAVLAPFQPQGSGLHPRQVMVPSECFPTCDPIITTINDCTSAQCACTTQHMDALASCMECTVTVTQSRDNVVNGQDALISFGENCAGDGFPLSVPTVTAAAPGVTQSLSGAGGNGPTQSIPNQSPPPTGIPLSLGVPTGSGSASSKGPTSPTQTVATPQGSQGGGATGRVPNGAPRVGNGVEITTLLFSLVVAFVAW